MIGNSLSWLVKSSENKVKWSIIQWTHHTSNIKFSTPCQCPWNNLCSRIFELNSSQELNFSCPPAIVTITEMYLRSSWRSRRFYRSSVNKARSKNPSIRGLDQGHRGIVRALSGAKRDENVFNTEHTEGSITKPVIKSSAPISHLTHVSHSLHKYKRHRYACWRAWKTAWSTIDSGEEKLFFDVLLSFYACVRARVSFSPVLLVRRIRHHCSMCSARLQTLDRGTPKLRGEQEHTIHPFTVCAENLHESQC